MKNQIFKYIPKESRETFVGFRPVIFDSKKSNPKKDRRTAKQQIRNYLK